MAKKILYILSHPIQYQSPLLKKMTEQPEIELKVLYLTNHTLGGKDKQFGVKVKWDTPLLKGYEYEFIKNSSPKPAVSGSFWGLINWGIIKKIRKEKAEIVIIHGWAYFTNWLVFLLSFLFKSKLWMRAESPLNQELLKRKPVLFLKKLILKTFVFGKIDKFLYIGKQNKEFYEYFGVKENKLVFAPYAVNNCHFTEQYESLKNKKTELRKELNIPKDSTVFLSAGKYINKKRPLDILEAFKKLNEPKSFLVLLGEGQLRGQMEEKIKKENIKNVILTGFINQSEISKYYASTDALILASTFGETWGLVVNEALNFGLPVIVSDMPGSAYDLVEHKQNGFVYKTGNTEELRKYMEFILNNASLKEKAKTLSLEKIKMFSYDVILENIIKQLREN